jgi:hypothetical protein
VISRKLEQEVDPRTWLGGLAEAKVLSKLVEGQFDVFVQFSGKAPFDLVAYKDGQLLRVNVKGTATKLRGAYPLRLREIRPNRTRNVIRHFDPKRCDVLAIYVAPLDKVCFLRSEEVAAKAQLNLRVEPSLYSANSWMIADLEDVSRILRGHTRDTCEGEDMVQTTTPNGGLRKQVW